MSIRIYVANLGKYNEGELVGKWINLPIDMNEEWEGIKQSIGIDGKQYEEWAIHDYECEFMKIGEYDKIEELNEIAEILNDLNESDINILKAILEYGYYQDNREAIENITKILRQNKTLDIII